jgi:predicted transcriptional regulator
MTKTAALSIRIEPELKAALEKLAEADRRSVAAYVEIALRDHVERQKRGKAKG